MLNQTPSRPTQRNAVYDVIDGERDYQDKTHPNSPPPSLAKISGLIHDYSTKLGNTSAADTDSARKRLRQIAALAVKGLEHHGASPRENHVPESAGVTGEMHLTGPRDAL